MQCNKNKNVPRFKKLFWIVDVEFNNKKKFEIVGLIDESHLAPF
jgi:hypothetical protein